MSGQLKSLSQLFQDRVFRIPDYQRGYSWGDRQWKDFWQDIIRLPEGRKHYTGLITLERDTNERWKNWGEDEETWLIRTAKQTPFYVVDGQQRLTTAVILINCLLEGVEGDDTEVTGKPKRELVAKYLFRESGPIRAFVFGYEKDNPSYAFLKSQILGVYDVQYEGTKTVYTANLLVPEVLPRGVEEDRTLLDGRTCLPGPYPRPRVQRVRN